MKSLNNLCSTASRRQDIRDKLGIQQMRDEKMLKKIGFGIGVGMLLIVMGCGGGGLSGTYSGGGMPFTKMTFTSADKVELTSIHGTITEAAYVIEGDKVKMTVAGAPTQVFTINSEGCIEGGGVIGTFCKE